MATWTLTASLPSTTSVLSGARAARAFSLVLLFLPAFSTRAAACYSTLDLEAEQGIRIHSELMVIGLTCIRMPGGGALYDGYEQFTRKNAGLIGGYESELINHYKDEGVPDPEKKLHTLRTDVANDISRKAIAMSTLSFCEKYAGHIDQALAMDEGTVRRWAQHVRPDQAAAEPLCSQ